MRKTTVIFSVLFMSLGAFAAGKAQNTKKVKAARAASQSSRAEKAEEPAKVAAPTFEAAKESAKTDEEPVDKMAKCKEAVGYLFNGGGSKCTNGIGVRLVDGKDNTFVSFPDHTFSKVSDKYNESGRPTSIKGIEQTFFVNVGFEYDSDGRLVHVTCDHRHGSANGRKVENFEEHNLELMYDTSGACSVIAKGETGSAASQTSGGGPIK